MSDFVVTAKVQIKPPLEDKCNLNVSMGQFGDMANVDIQCKKLNKSIRLSFNVLTDLESFYNLYQELVTKQRKSYLDKIAIELSDDLRYILDKKIQ